MSILVPLLISLVAVLFIAALALAWSARRLRAKSGIPYQAVVVYSDTGAWERPEKPLFSSRLGLTGKPDYVVRLAEEVIPIEVKPGRTAREPRESDVLQLMAYGLLLSEETGRVPSYGLLKYRDDVFRIEFTTSLQHVLMDTLDAMRADLVSSDVPRSHADASRCRVCGYREACGQTLSD